MNTHVKLDIKKLKKKRCKFLENIVTRYQNRTRMHIEMQISYLNLDPKMPGLFMASWYCCRIMNLYLFVKCIWSNRTSLCSLRFDMHSVFYLLCNDKHRRRVASGFENASEKELESLCLVEIFAKLMRQIRFSISG